ncbi:MAG TPA: metal-dependent hydrolase [Bryobacteraceae bacterium]|nr:metal-dependent hydrolase [Bryobacteraceae bacterium]
MDNLTHTLTGLALSRAGLNRWHPQAAILLMLSANAPDSDIVAASRGSLSYFEAHRGITHSVAMAPVMALLCVLAVGAFSRSLRGWKTAWGLCLIGVASHLLLDWTNAYGIRFLVPFSGRWFELDLNSLIDLWIWGVLLLAWVGPWLARLVSSEMGAPAGSGRALALFALSFVVVYDFGRWLAHQRAIETLNSRVYQGGPPLRAAAFPASAVNPFQWSGWIERPEFVMHFSMNLRDDFDPTAGTTIYKAEPGPAIEAARQTTPVEAFLKFSQYPLWRVMPVAEPEGARRVELHDWRFPFTASATVDSLNRVLSSSFHY